MIKTLSPRSIALRPLTDGRKLVEIRVGNKTDHYLATKTVQTGGEVWSLAKEDGTVYSVFLGNDPCFRDSCNCPGFKGHHHCKHVAGLRAAKEAGKL